MPDLDGLEATRLIRKTVPGKTPILLLSAYDWSGIEQEAMEVGIKHFLSKPFFMSNFKEAVQRIRASAPAPAQPEEKRSPVKGMRALVVDDGSTDHYSGRYTGNESAAYPDWYLGVCTGSTLSGRNASRRV